MSTYKNDIVLPTKKVKAERVNPKRLLVYSKPKTGKTTAFAGLKDNLILDDLLRRKSPRMEKFLLDSSNSIFEPSRKF